MASSENLQTPGPIEGLFFAQFHPTKGPKINYKYPPDCIDSDIFEKFSNFIIPKPEVFKNMVTVNSLGVKIKGYPNKIQDPKYERNALLYNLCLVFKPEARTSPYEPLVLKLSEYLHSLETESGFLSHEESREQLPLMLEQLYYDLNATGRCILKLKLQHPLHVKREEETAPQTRPEGGGSSEGERRLSLGAASGDRRLRDSCGGGGGGYERPRRTVRGAGGVRGGASAGECCGGRGCAMDRDIEQPEEIAVLYLKVVDACGAPVSVGEEQVPVLVKEAVTEEMHTLDLTTQQILPFIDGVAHVAKIASLSNVELELAKKCVQDLLYYKIVHMLPIFQYCNVYVHTTKVKQLYWSSVLQQKCLDYVVSDPDGHPLLVDDVFRLYLKFTYGRTVRQFCHQELLVGLSSTPPSQAGPAHPPTAAKQPPNVDIRRLVNFGLMHGLIKRLQPYPILDKVEKDEDDDTTTLPSPERGRADTLNSLSQSLRRFCDGTASCDLLCSKFGLSYKELQAKLAQDKDIVQLWQ